MTVILATPGTVCDTNWYPDSEASNHVTTDARNLITKTDFLGNNKVHMGDETLGHQAESLDSAIPIGVPNSNSAPCVGAADSFDSVLPNKDRLHITNSHNMITRSKNENEAATMRDEHLALMRNATWSLVSLPQGRKEIGCKWVFKIKENPNNTVNKYKARLVAKGLHQVAGFDFNEMFSPVMKPTTIRVILSITPARNWVVKQLDVNNAFLNGDLQEVHMQQPYGFQDPNQPTMVCHLHKFLYGLRQTLRA
ncbi:Retrovirus-related Pol polyprotein from transposon TNT 1-94 [Vitis vinifera]|uniref:Retrovirus-related Pol polyprotein from transposon TNT 1-94 n=2 Tax=Vitis vinifera TaxID=29760 RepID=A0A438CRJ5_VITVI|nr:Retrovirus-related Pol polyprotein from transposon TNT 1-94 [Vitis vinifera]